MHEKSIISRQVIEDHVVCSQLMKQKEKVSNYDIC